MRLSLPVRFRLAEGDHEQYGADWFTFDEAELTKLRARELMALDDQLREYLGLNVVTALAAYDRGETRGALAVMWMARRLGGVDEPLAEFNPIVLLAESQLIKAKAGDAGDPPASTSSSLPANAEASPS